MRILVTGGAGFIGSHLTDAYLAAGHEVLVVDNLSTGRKANLNPQASFVRLDIRDHHPLEEVFWDFSPQVVSHHAAQTSIAVALERPDLDAAINILGTINLLRLSQESKLKLFIFASSAAVYGQSKELPTKETALAKPINPYGITKMAGEAYLDFWAREHCLPVCVWRYANVYGPRQKASSESGVISIFAQRLREGKDLKIYSDGKQTRDFVYIGDIVDANLRLLDHLEIKEPLVLNLGTGRETTVSQLAQAVMAIARRKVKIKYLPQRGTEVQRSCLDRQKAVEKLGLGRPVSLRNGLKKMIG